MRFKNHRHLFRPLWTKLKVPRLLATSQLSLILLCSCKILKNDSAFKVINPEQAAQSFAEVVYIEVSNSQSLKRCSGTFIAANLLLTAAHCVVDQNNNPLPLIEYQSSKKVRHQGKAYPWQAFNINQKPTIAAQHDLALVQFDSPIAPKVAAMIDATPQVGDEVIIVGFGDTSINSTSNLETPIRQSFGRNIISNIYENFMEIRSSLNPTDTEVIDTSSLPGSGDSGGAAFNRKGELMGVISGNAFGKHPEGGRSGYGLIVDINDPHSKYFINETMHTICRNNTCIGCSISLTSPIVKWVFQLTPEGLAALNQSTQILIQNGIRHSNLGSQQALRWIDDLLGGNKSQYVKKEFNQIIGVEDALHHYYYDIASKDFLKLLESNAIDPSSYIKNSYENVISELKKEGRCGGGQCSLIYKLPKASDSDQFLEKLKNGPFQEKDIQKHLPESLKAEGLNSHNRPLRKIVTCSH